MGTVAFGESLCPVHGDSDIRGRTCVQDMGRVAFGRQSVASAWGQWHFGESLCPVAFVCVIGTWYWKGEEMAKGRKALLSSLVHYIFLLVILSKSLICSRILKINK